MSEIKVSLSGCCKPIPQDNIIGYITRGSGITIHRISCKHITDTEERLINVKWNANIEKNILQILLFTLLLMIIYWILLRKRLLIILLSIV